MKTIVLAVCAFIAVATYTITPVFALEPLEIYREKSPSVVLIYAKVSKRMSKGGSGFFIGDGLILTNAHVVTDKNNRPLTKISVYLKPGRVTGDLKHDLTRRYTAQIVKYNRPIDIAVLKIDGYSGSQKPLRLTDSEKTEIGQRVVAIGHPEQGGLWTLTTGTISSRKMNIGGVSGKHMFQTEASINHGNSGGPLIDSEGLVVGMNTSTSRISSDGTAIVGVNFALQSNVLLNWLNREGFGIRTASAPKAKPRKEVAAKREPEKTAPKSTPKVKESKPVKTAETKTIEKPEVEKPEKEGKIITPEKPYDWQNLEATVAEMEDMMDDMRGKIRGKF